MVAGLLLFLLQPGNNKEGNTGNNPVLPVAIQVSLIAQQDTF
jgi:hypothetical protein